MTGEAMACNAVVLCYDFELTFDRTQTAQTAWPIARGKRGQMPDDFDHEVIDSPEALLRHLHEAHGVAEALELDPETAPLQFWLRKHAELERAARPRSSPSVAPPPASARATAARAPTPTPTSARAPTGPAPPGPAPPGPAPPPAAAGPRFRPFADPLVEAVASALVRRGLDERQVRRGLSTYAGADGRRGEDAVRAAFITPMLDALTARLSEPDADFMAIADVLQRQRRSPAAARADAVPAARDAAPSPRDAAPSPRDAVPSPAVGSSPPREPDDDYMALANALQRRRGGRRRPETAGGGFTRS